GLRTGGIIEQDRAQDGAFGFHAGRQSAIENMVNGRHSGSQKQFPVFLILKSTRNRQQNGEKPEKRGFYRIVQAYIALDFRTKLDPACPSHTSRVAGWMFVRRVLPRGGVRSSASFSRAHALHAPMRFGFRQPATKPPQIKLQTRPLNVLS